jgi:hypothetical protein
VNNRFKTDRGNAESATVAVAASVADILHRVVARAAPALDAAAAASAAREASRLAAKHGAKSAVAKEAAVRAAELADTYKESVATARRTEVPIVVPAEGKAAIVGRVVDADGNGHKGLTVIAKVGDHAVGKATTEGEGVFQLDVKADVDDHKQKGKVLAQVDAAQSGKPPPTGSAEVILEVRKGDQVIHHDETPVKLTAGRSVYRELVITEK